MKQTPEEAIAAKLKVAAQRAGMIDLDGGLKLADMSKVTLEDDGTVRGADELMTAMKKAKPYLFAKLAKDMSPQEAAAALAKIKRGPPPEPVETTKRASEMTEAERQAYLREHKRRFE